ncbi:MAG TPA: isochorismatase family protein [Acidimicrobiia bacterium]
MVGEQESFGEHDRHVIPKGNDATIRTGDGARGDGRPERLRRPTGWSVRDRGRRRGGRREPRGDRGGGGREPRDVHQGLAPCDHAPLRQGRRRLAVHCVAGTWGAEFHPRMVVAGPTVLKGANGEDGYSGFTMRDPESGETVPTMLAAWLAEEGVERIVVVGLALDYCVKETARNGVRNGFSTVVLVGAAAAVDLEAGDGDRATEELGDAGVVIG